MSDQFNFLIVHIFTAKFKFSLCFLYFTCSMQNEFAFHYVWMWANDLHLLTEQRKINSSLSFSQALSFIINNKLQVTNNIWLSVVAFGSLCPVEQTCAWGKSSLDASFCSPWSIFVCVGLSWGILDSPCGRSLGDLFKHGVKTKETPYIKDAFPVCVWSRYHTKHPQPTTSSSLLSLNQDGY